MELTDAVVYTNIRLYEHQLRIKHSHLFSNQNCHTIDAACFDMSGNILEETDVLTEATDDGGQYEDDSIDELADDDAVVDFISLIAHVLLEARESYYMSTAAFIFYARNLLK